MPLQSRLQRTPNNPDAALEPATNLVPRTDVFLVAVDVNTLGDVWRLLLQRHEYIAGLVVKTYARPQTDVKLGNQSCRYTLI